MYIYKFIFKNEVLESEDFILSLAEDADVTEIDNFVDAVSAKSALMKRGYALCHESNLTQKGVNGKYNLHVDNKRKFSFGYR